MTHTAATASPAPSETRPHCCPECQTPLLLNNEVTGELACPNEACPSGRLFDPVDACADCGRRLVYDLTAEAYRHAEAERAECFLVPAFWPPRPCCSAMGTCSAHVCHRCGCAPMGQGQDAEGAPGACVACLAP